MNGWRTMARWGVGWSVATLLGCSATMGQGVPRPSVRALGGVTFVSPRCIEVRSCLLGQVVAAETSTPVARAAVFLVREGDEGAKAKPVDDDIRIVRLTDDQGVFTVADAPAGRYSVSVYKDARKISASGLELGSPGTLVVPIRLAPPT